MIRAVLFDMDGVLIDSHDAWLYIFNKSLKKFEGRTISGEEFDRVVWSKAFEKVVPKYFSVPLNKIREYYDEVYDEYRKRLSVINDTEEALSELKDRGIKMAVVSNTQRSIIQKVLKDVGLLDYFDFVVGGDDVANGKPEPDILYKAIELLKLCKEDALFVGDTSKDKMAAKKGGFKFVGFKLDGDFRVDNIKELMELV